MMIPIAYLTVSAVVLYMRLVSSQKVRGYQGDI